MGRFTLLHSNISQHISQQIFLNYNCLYFLTHNCGRNQILLPCTLVSARPSTYQVLQSFSGSTCRAMAGFHGASGFSLRHQLRLSLRFFAAVRFQQVFKFPKHFANIAVIASM